MNRLTILASLSLTALVSPAALADDVAAERARLANDRIRAEEELRAKAEAAAAENAQVEQAQVEDAQVEQTRKETDAIPASSATPAADRIEMSRALEQLRELGALKDAGHLTDEEFQLLKQKILDGV